MLPPDAIESLARQLYDARRARTQLRHFSRAYPQMTIDDGYAIQRAWVRLEQADGRAIKGREIDIYLANDREAKKFGRKQVRVEILSSAK